MPVLSPLDQACLPAVNAGAIQVLRKITKKSFPAMACPLGGSKMTDLFSKPNSEMLKKNISYLLDSLVAMSGASEPILLSGFWRSGTTWLQQLIADATEAKIIFEPLDRDSLIPYLRGKPVIYRGYIPATTAEFSKADWASLDRAFRGISPNRSGFSYVGRHGLSDALRKRSVVKLVRAQMILGELAQRYQPAATVHISRHPIPVVRSMMKADWDWSFSDIDLSNWYGPQTPGFEQLAQHPLNTPHRKVAALWALTERHVQNLKGVTFCRYEALVSDPGPQFATLMQNAGLTSVKTPDFSKDSPVTVKERQGISAQDRLTSWRKDVPQEMQDDIRAVLRDFWPEIDETWDLT